MNTLEAIQARRSVKQFDNTHTITEEEIHKLLTHATLSPTSFNIQHWRFVLVEDKELRAKLKEAAWGQEQVTEASLLLVLCADLNAWDKEPHRYWANAQKSVQEFMLPAIDGFYRDKEQVQRDEAIRSCGIAAQTIMLTAKEMGYDSCPMIGFDTEAVSELIKLPDDHIISMLITIGKPTQEASPRAGQLPLEELIIKNSF